MSSNDQGLGELVLQLAKNHKKTSQKWMKELARDDIHIMDSLVERAHGLFWRNTLNKYSCGLATALDLWYDTNISATKTNLDLVISYAQLSDPSTFGDRAKKEGNWVQVQQDPNTQIMCLRPAGFEGVHISIMCPVFYCIGNALDFGIPSPLDWTISARLAAIMGNPFKDESERLDAIRPILANLLQMGGGDIDYGNISVRKKAIRSAVTDWTIRLGECMILNVEMKNEKGAGGADPYLENVAYYVHFWADRGGPKRNCCPSLLVEIVGQEIGLSGAVWNQFPTVQPLSDNIPFLNATQDNRLRIRQARLIHAIRIGVEGLVQYYRQSHPLSDQCIFPYVSSFQIEDGTEVKFTYDEFLLKNTRKPIYLARTEDGNRIVVKFCPDRYGASAHEAMAELGFAPKLYACEEVGLMQMVVMEFVQGEQWFSPLHSPLYWEKLKGAIQLYHAEGFVHGDLRAPNILVTPDGPKILDFDWAGKIGDAKYLRVLNHKDITWHDEADINEPIVAEHDIFMLDQLKFNL